MLNFLRFCDGSETAKFFCDLCHSWTSLDATEIKPIRLEENLSSLRVIRNLEIRLLRYESLVRIGLESRLKRKLFIERTERFLSFGGYFSDHLRCSRISSLPGIIRWSLGNFRRFALGSWTRYRAVVIWSLLFSFICISCHSPFYPSRILTIQCQCEDKSPIPRLPGWARFLLKLVRHWVRKNEVLIFLSKFLSRVVDPWWCCEHVRACALGQMIFSI